MTAHEPVKFAYHYFVDISLYGKTVNLAVVGILDVNVVFARIRAENIAQSIFDGFA
jgi:hypothetical protein